MNQDYKKEVLHASSQGVSLNYRDGGMSARARDQLIAAAITTVALAGLGITIPFLIKKDIEIIYNNRGEIIKLIDDTGKAIAKTSVEFAKIASTWASAIAKSDIKGRLLKIFRRKRAPAPVKIAALIKTTPKVGSANVTSDSRDIFDPDHDSVENVSGGAVAAYVTGASPNFHLGGEDPRFEDDLNIDSSEFEDDPDYDDIDEALDIKLVELDPEDIVPGYFGPTGTYIAIMIVVVLILTCLYVLGSGIYGAWKGESVSYVRMGASVAVIVGLFLTYLKLPQLFKLN